MTAHDLEDYFQYHNSNMKLLKIGFNEIRNQIKAIHERKNSNGNFIYKLEENDPELKQTQSVEKALSRTISGIQVSYAEESIKRLFYEKNLFNDTQRDFLFGKSALDQKWYFALKFVFSIAYDLVPTSDPTCTTVNIRQERNNLGDEIVDKYFELKSIITNFLVPNFQIRNKVQHGEWEYAFKPPQSDSFSQPYTDRINHENIITSTSRFTLVESFYNMIVDLGRFKSNSFAIDSMLTPFEYFYGRNIEKINFEKQKIINPNLNLFIEERIEKLIRGQEHKLNNKTTHNNG